MAPFTLWHTIIHFMKHLFLSLAAMSAVVVGSWAQCTADFDFMGASFGISPNPLAGESFEDGFVGSPYEDIIHVLTPALSSDIPDLPIDLPITLPVDSITLNSISLIGEQGEAIALEEVGLSLTANNNGDSGNAFTFLGGGQYCATLSGVPDSAGMFMASLNVTGYIAVFGSPVAYDFPFEGFSLTISAQPVLGCTDETACNFDAEATEDDGSCTYAEPLYDCDGNCLNDLDGDGVCEEVPGCTDEMACNFDPVATEDDSSCTYAEIYYDCEGNCLADMDGDGICDELEVAGCTDATACNFNETATDEDGSCTYAEDYYDCDGDCLNDTDMDGICDELEVAGCANPDACNFDEEATEDDGSCVVTGDACDDGDEATIFDTIDENCDCVGEFLDGITAPLSERVKIFPNPAVAFLHLTLPEGKSYEITLFSVAGQRTVATQHAVSGQVAWDVAHLPAGVYLLQIGNDAGVIVRQVVIGGR